MGIFSLVSRCPICDAADSEVVWELPAYPFTEQLVSRSPQDEGALESADQSVLFCPSCTHVFLGKQHNPSLLYNDHYETVASKSNAAVDATQRLLGFANAAIGFSDVDLVFDIGANDGTFLRQLRESGFKGQRAALDPSFSNWDEEIAGFTAFIEDFDFSLLPASAKTVFFASHVVEHLADPLGFFLLLSQEMSGRDYLVVQFPALEPLVRDFRFDQIHHQHFHYFSWQSLLTAVVSAEMEVVSTGLDWSHYGAGNLVLRKKRRGGSPQQTMLPWGESSLEQFSPISVGQLRNAINVYESYQAVVNQCLSAGQYVALGAGLMSPIVFYHLAENWGRCVGLYDDEVSKHGTQYAGTPLAIGPLPPSLDGEVVLISGSVSKSAGRKLTEIAFAKGARSLIYPVLNL